MNIVQEIRTKATNKQLVSLISVILKPLFHLYYAIQLKVEPVEATEPAVSVEKMDGCACAIVPAVSLDDE